MRIDNLTFAVLDPVTDSIYATLINRTNNQDRRLVKIDAVPEPGTLAALVRRRRTSGRLGQFILQL